MDPARAREILRALADGRDPATGAAFPPDSPYQQAETVRALYLALEALDTPPAKSRSADPNRPNLNQKWTPEEEQRLRDAFAANTPIPQIATTHGRSAGAITSRLVKLGLIQDDFGHPAHRGRPPVPTPPTPAAPSPAAKPDDPLPF